MEKLWLTGKEVMETYGIQAIEIGKACYEQRLRAYQANTSKKILEETKTAKIPRHFPNGIDPRKHIKYGVNVEWENDFDWGNEWDKHYLSLILKNSNYDVYFPKNNKIIPFDKRPETFLFKIEDYIKYESAEQGCVGDCHRDSDLYKALIKKYVQDISNMIFKPTDIQSCFMNKPGSTNTNPPLQETKDIPDKPLVGTITTWRDRAKKRREVKATGLCNWIDTILDFLEGKEMKEIRDQNRNADTHLTNAIKKGISRMEELYPELKEYPLSGNKRYNLIKEKKDKSQPN